jgi:hypothetical protein
VRKVPTKYGFEELQHADELEALLISICTGYRLLEM